MLTGTGVPTVSAHLALLICHPDLYPEVYHQVVPKPSLFGDNPRENAVAAVGVGLVILAFTLWSAWREERQSPDFFGSCRRFHDEVRPVSPVFRKVKTRERCTVCEDPVGQEFCRSVF